MQSAADCEWMAMDIKSKLHDGPSVNTLKRLLGFLPYDKQHRDSTMSFIAHYLVGCPVICSEKQMLKPPIKLLI